MRRNMLVVFAFIFIATMMACVFMSGCSESTEPEPEPESEPGLTVEVSPDTIEASWSSWYNEWKFEFMLFIIEKLGVNVTLSKIQCIIKTPSDLVYQDFSLYHYDTRPDVFFFVYSEGSGSFRMFGESPQADTLADIEEEGSLGFYITPTSLPANSQQRIDAYIYDPVAIDGYTIEFNITGTCVDSTIHGSGSAVLVVND